MVHSKRALTLWAILRSFVLSTHRKTTKNLPYQLTIKHGFLNNYQLHTRHQIISSVYHQFTRVLQEPIRDVNSDEDFLFVDVLQGTFVVVLVSDTNHLLYWEINNSQGIIPSPTSYYLDFNLDSIIFLSRFGVYAACSDESWIKFLNQKFQVISTRPTTHSVQHIHYEPATNRLVAIGSHELSSFLLKGKLTRGKLRVDAILETNRVLLSPDEWIKATFAVQKQIIVSVDNKIHLLEAKSLKTIAVVDCQTNRHVSCIQYHPLLGYTIAGFSDGCIKVFNSTLDCLTKFTSHKRTVTLLLVFQRHNLLISASKDHSIRMYNLSNLTEIYTVFVKELPSSLELLTDNHFAVVTGNECKMFDLNYINVSFCDVNSPIKRLDYFKSSGLHGRVVIRTDDGVCRIMSPDTNKCLTTTLPLIELDSVIDLAYSITIDRIFVLLENKEIWIFDTKTNPSNLIDIWRPNKNRNRQEIEKIVVFSSQTFLSGKMVKYRILIGSTIKGQMVIFNQNGIIQYEAQIHASSIINLTIDVKRRLILSSGLDRTIKLCSINPSRDAIIVIVATINTDYIPRHVSSIRAKYICSGSEEGHVHMYSIDALSQKVTEIHEHSRSEDHVDKVTCICSIPTYELFITSSKDGVIKVWNVSNALIREIVFTEPIMFLAVLGRCGDILFGIQNRVDMIKAKNYLPPGYHELISSMIRKKLVKGFDEPINFQENIEYDLDFHKEEPHLRIHLNRLEWLADANLSAVARKTIAKPIPTQDVVATVEVNETLIEKDEQTIENGNFEQVEIDAKFVSANEDFNIENDPEYQMFIRHKNFKYMMADEEVFDEADLLSLPLKNMDRLQSIRPKTQQKTGRFYGSRYLTKSQDDILEKIAFVKLDEDLEAIKERDRLLMLGVETKKDPIYAKIEQLSIQEKLRLEKPLGILDKPIPIKKNKLITSSIPIAPDGNVPNSIVESKIEKFRDTHKDYRVDKVEIVSYVKKGVTVMTSVEEDRLQKKENYKMKLKEMMDKRNDAKEQENERLEEIARFEALKQLDILRAKELETARIEEEKRKLLEEQRKRAEAQALKLTEAYGANLAAAATRPKSRASTPNKSRPGTKSAKKSRLQTPEAIARVIEQARDQEWFPINEIYINDEPDDSPYAGLRKPKLKIDATIEALLPFALKVFESKETENVTKVKILNYIDDMQDEYGYLSIVPITTVFSNYLLRNIHEPIESNEIDFRFRIMDSWIQLESNLDIIVILFIYLILGSPLLQQASLDFLTHDFKFKNPDSIYIKERIEDVYAENPASTDYFEQVIAPSIASRDKSIEKVDRLLSVLNLIPNKEEADKRIQDCNNIDISTASLPSNSTDALKSNVMRMFRNIIKDFLVANVADKSIAEEVYNLTPFGNPCSIFLQLPAEASLLNTQNTKTKKAITKKALDKAAETLDEIIAKRNPIEILKTPFVEDLEEAVNFYTVYCETNRNKKQALYEQALIKIALDEEKRLAHEEIKRQELIKLALRNEEKERIEKEKELKLAKIKAMAITEKPDVKIWSKGKQTKTVEEFLAPKPKRPIDANRLDGAFNPTIAKNTLPKARIRLDPFDQGVRDSQVLKFEAMIDNEWLQKTLLEEGQDLTANKQISVFTTNLKYFVP